MKRKSTPGHGPWQVFYALLLLVWTGAALAQCPPGIRAFELYILDTKTGEVVRVTDQPEYGLFNASFSNDGKTLVHEMVSVDETTYPDCWPNIPILATTDIKTGVTTMHSDQVANEIRWSPNGQRFVFDQFLIDPYIMPWSIYVMPAGGGDPEELREWAASASWSNDSKRVAFADVDFVENYPDWGYIGTIDLDGNEVRLDSVGAFGCALDYSPNGKLIVYMEGEPVNFGGCFGWGPYPLKAVPVNRHGEPLGDPYPITDGMYYDTAPTVSGNGKQVVFHSNRSTTGDFPWEFDLWAAPTDGSGQVTKLYGLDGVEEYDPSYSKNGRYIVFSSDRDAVAQQP